MGIRPCKVCGFAALRGEDYCWHHSNSQKAQFVKKKWEKSVGKLRDNRERRINNFEREILRLLDFQPKSEFERKRRTSMVKQILDWIREIRRE